MFEELLIGDNPMSTKYKRIMKAQEEFLELEVLMDYLDQLKTTIDQNNVSELKRIIKKLVPGYEPQSELVDWIHLEQQKQSAVKI